MMRGGLQCEGEAKVEEEEDQRNEVSKKVCRVIYLS